MLAPTPTPPWRAAPNARGDLPALPTVRNAPAARSSIEAIRNEAGCGRRRRDIRCRQGFVAAGSDGAGGRLDGWKAIAAYLGRTVRTVQRWEREQRLPVCRLRHNT